MSTGLNQEYQPYRNRLLEVEPEVSDEVIDIGNKQFIMIVGAGVIVAVLAATILSLIW